MKRLCCRADQNPTSGTLDCLLAPGQGCFLLSVSNAFFSSSQDPSVTQLTSAPQSGLAEFNPFSEVGDYVLSKSRSFLGEGGMCVSGRCQGVWSKNVAGEEQLWRVTVLRGTVVLKWTCGK